MPATKSPSNRRTIEIPGHYQNAIATALRQLDYAIDRPKPLAECVLRLSDFYTKNGHATTPWREKWAQVANLCYYFPLNYARNLAVAKEAMRLGFFADLTSLTDFGSGLGAALFALLDLVPNGLSATATDASSDALNLGRALKPERMNYRIDTLVPRLGKNSLVSASYFLTEVPEPPPNWLNAEALMILEPGTELDGRQLHAYRQQLIEQGFYIWAPCTHQDSCPLLNSSKRDWCHDRIHWLQPDWFAELERHLPIKNKTLTFSYLLARKSKEPPPRLKALARLTGDMQVEKGKTKQALCRGSEREFLTWFPQRMSTEIELQRGSLVELRGPIEKRNSEARIKDALGVHEMPPTEVI